MPIVDRLAREGYAVGTLEIKFEALHKDRTCTKVLRWSGRELA